MRLIRRDKVICVGSQIRDEFCCPITHELFRDPVIAADGHTYDRNIIEKWLSTHDTSPKTRQKLSHTQLTPNLNLKRLIENLLFEGGLGLFEKIDNSGSKPNEDCKVETNSKNDHQKNAEHKTYGHESTSKIAIVREKIAIFNCIGPNDSNWMDKSFQVNQNGAIGGRKRPVDLGKQDFIQFTETVVSRRHFEVIFEEETQSFGICDLGSAGGTFWRLNFGVPFTLKHETVFLIGKHQLMSIFPDSQPIDINDLKDTTIERNIPDDPETQRHNYESEDSNNEQSPERNFVLSDDVSVAERHFKRVTLDETVDDINDHLINTQGQNNFEHDFCLGQQKSLLIENNALHSSQEHKSVTNGDDVECRKHNNTTEIAVKNIQIKCIAPDKSPFEGVTFNIDRNGATLGRKVENKIPFVRIESDKSVIGLDSAISGWHARIVYDEHENGFTILDGTETRPSTNGTWIRLGRGQKESEIKRLSTGLEVLIGILWFRVHISETVSEVQLDSENIII